MDNSQNPPGSQQLATIEPRQVATHGAFDNISAFESAQRMASALAKSAIVPQQYQNNVANCIVALEISQRTGSSILAVMQGLHVIHGKPGWSGQYVIGAVNGSGRFKKPLAFRFKGEGDKRECVAHTINQDGEALEGPPVTIAMAKAEGWFGKAGSKWQTMPELMLTYRAASFFGRVHAADILFGMQTEEELRDVTPGSADGPAPDAVADLNEKLKAAPKRAPKKPVVLDAEIVPTPADAPEPQVTTAAAGSSPEFF